LAGGVVAFDWKNPGQTEWSHSSLRAMTVRETTPEELLGPLNEVEQKNAPERLFVAGDVALLRNGPRVSIVGSRKASAEGLKRTRSLAKALVTRGIVVVSGLAEGIDTTAHETTLEERGHTIAVIGTPLDQAYPAKNRALQERLTREQLVVSQFAPGHAVQPKNFPIRNRTMALLTDATVIVEAGEKSGTLHQGWEALRLGRLLFLMESVANDSKLSWPAKMLGYGAQVLSRENLEVVLDEMPEFPRGELLTL
jgi:DNA processing protein